ncbi:MAG TPA: cupredoxin family copper-binding protein [Gemmataceae bacterium]|nr:cupredoxin family copper-binding protein [Gemmataceae bacterium]
MQRFRLMNVYVAAVLLLLAVAIATVTSLRPTRADATSTNADSISGGDAVKLSSNSASTQTKATKQAAVAIDDFKFTPRELSVAVGDTVTWVNHDDVPHTATSKDDPAAFDSKALDTDDKYSFTFTKPGTYRYYCKVHTHMTGSIIVK